MASISVGGVTWHNSGATPDADGVRWIFTDIDGWHDGSPTKGTKTDRPQAHGSFAERVWRGGRLVTLTGYVEAPTRALASGAQIALAALLAEGTFDELTVDDEDQGVLSARVRLEGQPAIDWFGHTDITCQFGFFAPDPLRYGPRVAVPTGFPVAVGGLRWPLYSDGAGGNVGALDYGPASTTGRLLLANPGTAAASIQHEVVGPVDAAGFEIIEINGPGRLVFEGPVPAGSALLLDGATGAVLMDGYADRGDVLTSRVWPVAARLGSVELFFRPRGSTSAATLTSSLAPAYW